MKTNIDSYHLGKCAGNRDRIRSLPQTHVSLAPHVHFQRTGSSGNKQTHIFLLLSVNFFLLTLFVMGSSGGPFTWRAYELAQLMGWSPSNAPLGHEVEKQMITTTSISGYRLLIGHF